MDMMQIHVESHGRIMKIMGEKEERGKLSNVLIMLLLNAILT